MRSEPGNAINAQSASHTIALVQLSRIGDIIQTAQAVQFFKAKYPHYRLVLIARSQFARPLTFFLKNYFDRIYVLNNEFRKDIKQTGGLDDAVSKLNVFLNEINSEKVSVLINLTFSKTSEYVCSLINASHKIGPYKDKKNVTNVSDNWSQLLISTVQRGPFNPYSLVDLFKKIIGIDDSVERKLFHASIKHNSNARNIIIHPFASHERKMWNPDKWVEIIYKVLKDNDSITITLVGSKEESPHSINIVSNPALRPLHHRIINLVGKTSIESLYEHLKNARLFVGHDSMVGHLASVLQIPSLTISLGTVRPSETTPYQQDAICISPKTKCFPCFPQDYCKNYQCQHDVSYQLVVSLVNLHIKNININIDSINTNISDFHLNSANICISKFSQNYYRLDSLVENYTDINDIFKSIYLVAWSFILEDCEIRIPFPKLTTQTHKILFDCLDQIQRLFELNDFGKKYTQFILEEISSKTPSLAKIKEYSKKIDEIDQLMNLVLNTCPFLAPVIEYGLLKKSNLLGENIVQLSESAYLIYEQSAQTCSIIYELIENIIAEYKITQIRTHSTKGKID